MIIIIRVCNNVLCQIRVLKYSFTFFVIYEVCCSYLCNTGIIYIYIHTHTHTIARVCVCVVTKTK
jgi:hypothetical protein